MVSGDKRVDERKLGAIVGERIVRADADFVRERTRFAIGGAPQRPSPRPRSLRPFVGSAALARIRGAI
jgi:prolyl-tRNA editing enzyme YbaK/EbsC (Cys-tRNA(Pro) deacylase)